MKIGRLLGVNIYLNPFFLALLALFFVAGVLEKGLLAFAVVLVHEFSHTFVARRLNVAVSEVELLPFGGVTRMSGDLTLDPLKETLVAAAGPFSNFCLIGLALASKNYGFWNQSLGPFFLQCNILIAFFNLLPALPLDGGRVYRAFLAGRIGLKRATYKAAGLGQAWAGLITGAGAVSLAVGWSGLDIIITGLFLLYAATREKISAPYFFIKHLAQKKNELLREGKLPGSFFVALENVPLGQVVKGFVPGKYHLVVVLGTEDLAFMGVAGEDSILEAMLELGLDVPVGDVPRWGG